MVDAGGSASLWDRDAMRDASRYPVVGVDVASRGGQGEDAASAGLAVLAKVHEVAETVSDKRVTKTTRSEYPVGVASDDDVRARSDEQVRELFLFR